MSEQISNQKRIASYQILSKLGQGAMGIVYKASQEPLGREVALKVLPPAMAKDKKFCERFVREAKAAASVVHPNVVTCHDAGHDNGNWYMALEFVAGGDAEGLLKNCGANYLPESKALGIIRDCARGLVAVHDAHLVHRDIKPANIFIAEDGTAKLADLGLVFFTEEDDRLTMPGAVMGSPAYMPPEQARGDDDIDIRADIYGLGASLFHLCCGRPPFTGKTPLMTLQQVLHEILPDPRMFNPSISDECIAIIKMALEKERGNRYAQPQELLDDLECAMLGRPLMHAKAEKKRRNDAQREDAQRAQDIQRQRAQQAQAPEATLVQDLSGAAEETANEEIAESKPTHPQIPQIKTQANKKLDVKALELLCKRIRVNESGTAAWLSLAPGASFPRDILAAMMNHLQISYGIDQGALMEATRTSSVPRRIVIARGDDPSPGFPGRSVYDSPIAPLAERIVIRIAPDRMSAYALSVPNVLLDKEEVKRAVVKERVCYGIDTDAIHRLSEGPADASGRLLIARGRKGRPPMAAGFRLENKVMNTTVSDVASANFQKVKKGDIVARWEDALPSETGMDVCGRPLHYEEAEERQPEDCVDEGVEITRGRDGQLLLKALVDGVCQMQSHGQIRVINAMEINGDLTVADGAIKTNELLIVRGDVADDVEIESGGDVVIMGDLNNATIRTSGSIIIDGEIKDGDNEIVAAGAIEADGIKVRHVMAGSVCIRGEVVNSELIATGDIVVDRVIGGRLCAGGTITALDAGDETGVTTELWAGHNLDYGEQKEMAVVEERRLSQKRSHLLEQQRQVDSQVAHIEARKLRLQGAAFVKKGENKQLLQELAVLQKQQQRLDRDGEQMRDEIGQRRRAIDDLGHLNNNEDAEVMVKGMVNKGVIVKLADAEAEVFRRLEENVKRSMKEEE